MKKLKNILFVIIPVLFLSSVLYALPKKQKKLSVAEIISNSAEFKGYQKYSEFKDIVCEGNYTENKNIKYEFVIYHIKPADYRLKLKTGHVSVNFFLINDSGFVKADLMSKMPIAEIKRLELAALVSPIEQYLYNYKKSGLNVNLSQEIKISGVECYKIILTDKKGNQTDVFIAKDNFRIVKIYQNRIAGNEPALVEIYYENYQDFNGLKIPTEIEAYIADREIKMKIEKTKYNSGLNASDFGKTD